MTLLGIKIAMEQYMVSNYTETTVHYAGMKYDTTADTEWLYFEYQGSVVSDCGLDNTKSIHDGVVKLISFAPTSFRAVEIMDTALDLFSVDRVAELMPKSAYINKQGYDKELDKSYIEIEIEMGSI